MSVSPAWRKKGPSDGAAPSAQQPGVGRLGTPCRNQPGQDCRIQREQLEERPIKVFHRDEAAGFGHTAELAHNAGEFRLRQVWATLAHQTQSNVASAKGKSSTLPTRRSTGAAQRPSRMRRSTWATFSGRQIERGNPTRGADEFAHERDVTPRATARIEHRPARLDARRSGALPRIRPWQTGSGGPAMVRHSSAWPVDVIPIPLMR